MAFDAFALIIAMLVLGMAFARLGLFPADTAEALNAVVLYVCLPAAILLYVPRLHVDASVLGLVATPWLLALATVGLVLLAARVLRLRREQYAVLLLCVALGNTSFIGYPMVRALLGDAALPYAVVYDQFGTFVLLSTFGLYVLARYGGDVPPTPRQVLVRMLKFPPLWALLFALALMPERPPPVDRIGPAARGRRAAAAGDAGGGPVDPAEAAPRGDRAAGRGPAAEAAGDAGDRARAVAAVRHAWRHAPGQRTRVGHARHDHRRRPCDIASARPAPGCGASRLRHPPLAGDAAGLGVAVENDRRLMPVHRAVDAGPACWWRFREPSPPAPSARWPIGATRRPVRP
jgi:hypothetical protein